MNHFLCAFVVIAASCLLHQALATDYCSTSLCSGGNHIACGHSGGFAASCPTDATIVTMTDEFKNLMVTAHNTRRNFIAGGNHANHSAACRMPTIKWDNELAQLAELNVRQCAIAHDKCRNTAAFKYSGQNLAWMATTGTFVHASRLQQAVDMWYNEVSDSRQSYVDKYPSGYSGPAIGHFTVMVAERNTHMGCAAATYTANGWKNYLVACNYATTNMINFPIYVSCPNAPASKCTTGTNPAYPNLCSTTEVVDPNKFY